MSDQDFFFDEDETAEDSASEKPVAKKAPAQKQARPAAATTVQSVSVTVAALIGVVALLAGIIVGILIPSGGSTAPTATSSPVNGSVSAPQLSEDQLTSGELPAGHPDLGDMGASATATPEAAPTE